MARLTDWFLLSLFPALVLLHLYVSPYTKVEESFNIQAIHDILTYGIPSKNVANRLRAQYDHFSFPGAVPRTFVGALAVAGTAKPILWVNSQLDRQLVVRGVVGCFNALVLISYARGVRRAFGKNVAVWYILFQASQFHVMYYASRTLPNMFAFGITTFAFRYLLPEPASTVQDVQSRKRCRLSLYLLTITGIIFRSEIALLLATTTIHLWAKNRISFRSEILPAAISGLTIGLLTTITTDSIFWQKFPLWPELAAFKYNVVSGHASAWGTSPWHFYLTNALPRLFLNPITYALCIPLSILQPATRRTATSLLLPAISYIFLYSLQPHKEWRFILYTIPPITTAAALGASYIWTHRTKTHILYPLLATLLCLSTLTTFVLSTFLLLPISAANYPGAYALKALHNNHPYNNIKNNSTRLADQQTISVHLDNLACQTGVTRFLQKPPPKSPLIILPGSPDGRYPELRSGEQRWVYDKTSAGSVIEMEKARVERFWASFDYLLVEVGDGDGDGESDRDRPGRWEVVDEITGFGGVRILRPGEGEVSGGFEEEILGKVFGGKAVDGWRWVKGFGRKYVTRGWWVEVRIVPKIRVLRRVL
ncbi:alpha-1,6-mannosyltransferase subunit [Blastomyces dermatitidis ER-3]|uniref:Mannosyltransferase n=1 Tax=Ajellomyces dermatitidis (strain ER-3 / ATCC MYA-2586) TaxID=559297 RepID=A0ABX2VU72_AJEDR|nr:alpha-1,6-mannosyltransferase subunit [Blastomyces dermatitidis ER-3]OAT00660.1 alpha-1,6-mannosyltransferase subunit [Blastomyces dermatitidis ER-3]